MNKKTIVTFSGKQMDLNNLGDHEFDIRDIAHALSMSCRFNGHLRDFYSVAQHSCIISKMVDHSLLGLLHDAHEAYTTDMPWPFKNEAPKLKEIQNKIDSYLLPEMVGVASSDNFKNVKTADIRMGLTEARDLFLSKNEHKNFCAYKDGYRPYDFEIKPWNPKQAECRFLNLYEEYKYEYKELEGS